MRKAGISIFVFVISLSLCHAQSISDVVRYGTENSQGTARFRAMGGAFGALGADISAIQVNPAGSAVFSKSKMTMSASSFMFDNTTSYYGNEETTDGNYFDLNQAGGVFVFKLGNRDSKWKKITLGLNYDQANNFENEFYSSGSSDISISQYFLTFATGRAFGDIIAMPGESVAEAYINIGNQLGFGHQQAFLGNEARIIRSTDDSDPTNTNYVTNTGNPVPLYQEYFLSSAGNHSKYTVNLATQISNFYVGASANYHIIRYDRLTQFDESGYDAASTALEYMYFDNLLSATGNAFSFSVGAIAKIKERFRVGLSYQSPVSYTLTEELSQAINSNLAFPSLSEVSFSIVNVFPDYDAYIPAKFTGSFAVVFGKNGVISFDYDYQDFSNAQLRPASDPFFDIQNTLINTRLKAVSSYRIGGEYRFFRRKSLSVRGGYRIQESPYTNGTTVGDLHGYSFGLGYNFGGTQIDASFNQNTRAQNHQLFDPGFAGLTNVDTKRTNITLSLSFGL